LSSNAKIPKVGHACEFKRGNGIKWQNYKEAKIICLDQIKGKSKSFRKPKFGVLQKMAYTV
jgi:hypothetical protein